MRFRLATIIFLLLSFPSYAYCVIACANTIVVLSQSLARSHSKESFSIAWNFLEG